jgi:hypothetical protein
MVLSERRNPTAPTAVLDGARRTPPVGRAALKGPARIVDTSRMADEVHGVIRSMSTPSLAFAGVEGRAELLPVSALNGGGRLSLGAPVVLTVAEDGSVLNWRPSRQRFPAANARAHPHVGGGAEWNPPELPPAA